MKLLILDQSTSLTGYSVWQDRLQNYGIIDFHKNTNSDERFRQMTLGIKDLILQYSPDKVVIEDVAQQSNVNVLKVLARLQGAILGFCYLYGIDYDIVKPTVWRSKLEFAQGAKVKRSELKRQALEYVRQTYKLDVIEDVAEAICIGEAYLK